MDPSRETNNVDVTSCSQYANMMSSTKKESKTPPPEISLKLNGQKNEIK